MLEHALADLCQGKQFLLELGQSLGLCRVSHRFGRADGVGQHHEEFLIQQFFVFGDNHIEGHAVILDAGQFFDKLRLALAGFDHLRRDAIEPQDFFTQAIHR